MIYILCFLAFFLIHYLEGLPPIGAFSFAQLWKIPLLLYLLLYNILNLRKKERFEKAGYLLSAEYAFCPEILINPLNTLIRISKQLPRLLIRDNMVFNTVSSPTKICEYLAVGLPLVCTQFSGDYACSIVNGETGYVLKSSIATATELSELQFFLQDVKENPPKYSERCLEKVTQRTFEFEFATLIDKMGNFMKI